MGNPYHYSIELPQRCLQLIEELWQNASEIRLADQPDLGPLTATFLISMSMPIINLPFERMGRQLGAGEQGYADDRRVNPEAAAEFVRVVRRQSLRQAPFYSPGAWRFARHTDAPFPNTAEPLSDRLALELATEDAAHKAAAMPASEWCSILRNALAHGGIAYLDERGASSYGTPVKMYAFASRKYAEEEDENGRRPLVAVNFLRISEIDYLTFLQEWVAWLRESNIVIGADAA